jgi:uncharacterized membrane protein YqjE
MCVAGDAVARQESEAVTDASESPGAATQRLLATLLEIAQTRLDLAATELAAERLHWAEQALVGVLALMTCTGGVVLGVIALAWWCEPAQRVGVLAAGGALLVALAAGLLLHLRRQRRRHTPLLHDTLALLREDVAALRGTPR